MSSKYKKVVQPVPETVCEPIKDWPEAERPREKLFQSGPAGLSDGELLAVLLRTGKLGQSAEEMGRHLLTKFKGISGIDRAHFEELLAVPGMGIAKTAQLKAAIEIGKRARIQNAQPKGFNNVADVTAYIRPRFEGLVQGYEKPLLGTLAVLEIGLANIRRECPHFNEWLSRLEARSI